MLSAKHTEEELHKWKTTWISSATEGIAVGVCKAISIKLQSCFLFIGAIW